MRPMPANQLNPKVKFAWRLSAFISTTLTFLIVFAFAGFGIMMASMDDPTATDAFMMLPMVLPALGIAWLVVVLFTVVINPQLRYMRWRYEVGQWELYLAHGIFWRTRTVIPFVRVQNTDTKQGPLMRMLGLASVSVSTAAGSREIPGLTLEEAEQLRDVIATQARLAQEDL